MREVESLIDDLNLNDRVKMFGYVDRSVYLEYLKSAKVNVLAKPPNFQSKYCMPTKLAEYLASGTPVIVSKTGVIDNYLTDGQSAYIVADHDVSVFADVIKEILNNLLQSTSIGEKGKEKAMKEFDYKKNAKKLINFIHQLHA